MMSFPESHVLVELNIADLIVEPDGAIAVPGATIHVVEQPSIKRVVRAYLSADRAEEDLALLAQASPGARYAVQHVPYIDN